MLGDKDNADFAGGSGRLESAGKTRLQGLRQHAKFPKALSILQGKN
jgi:hypothetical protein